MVKKISVVISLIFISLWLRAEVTSDAKSDDLEATGNIELAQKTCENMFSSLTELIKIPTPKEMKEKSPQSFDLKKYEDDVKRATRLNESRREYMKTVKNAWGDKRVWMQDCVQGFSYGNAQSESFVKSRFKQGKVPTYSERDAFCKIKFPYEKASSKKFTLADERRFLRSITCSDGLYSYGARLRAESQANMSHTEIADKFCKNEFSKSDKFVSDLTPAECKKAFMSGLGKSKDISYTVRQKLGFSNEFLFTDKCDSCLIFNEAVNSCVNLYKDNYSLQWVCTEGARNEDKYFFNSGWNPRFDRFFD